MRGFALMEKGFSMTAPLLIRALTSKLKEVEAPILVLVAIKIFHLGGLNTEKRSFKILLLSKLPAWLAAFDHLTSFVSIYYGDTIF